MKHVQYVTRLNPDSKVKTGKGISPVCLDGDNKKMQQNVASFYIFRGFHFCRASVRHTYSIMHYVWEVSSSCVHVNRQPPFLGIWSTAAQNQDISLHSRTHKWYHHEHRKRRRSARSSVSRYNAALLLISFKNRVVWLEHHETDFKNQLTRVYGKKDSRECCAPIIYSSFHQCALKSEACV